MDFTAVFNDGEMANIEMQCIQTKDDLNNRFTYYLCGMLISQELKGKDYNSLNPCYVIVILNFNLFDEDRELLHTFKLRDKGIVFNNLISLITIELPKLDENRKIEDYNEIEAWSYFFKYGNKIDKQDTIQLLTTRFGGIRMAEESRNRISESQLEFLINLRKRMYDREDYYEELEQRSNELEKKCMESEQKCKELEIKQTESEQRYKESEQRYKESEQKCKESEQRYKESEKKLMEKEERIRQLEQALATLK